MELYKIWKNFFDLPKADCKILDFLVSENKRWDTEELRKEFKYNLTTVQRAVKRIKEFGLINQHQKNLSGGGYKFLYQIKPKKELVIIIKEIIAKKGAELEAVVDKWGRK